MNSGSVRISIACLMRNPVLRTNDCPSTFMRDSTLSHFSSECFSLASSDTLRLEETSLDFPAGTTNFFSFERMVTPLGGVALRLHAICRSLLLTTVHVIFHVMPARTSCLLSFAKTFISWFSKPVIPLDSRSIQTVSSSSPSFQSYGKTFIPSTWTSSSSRTTGRRNVSYQSCSSK